MSSDPALVQSRRNEAGPSVQAGAVFGAKAELAAVVGIAILILYAILRSVLAAEAKPLWYDEVCTWIVATQPRVGDISRALRDAADGQPPAYYVVERLAGLLSRHPEISLRLPSIASFAITMAAIFVFVRKRSGNVVAVLCAGLLLATVVYDGYAIEARPYSLVLAFISLALVCYQRAPSPFWMVGLGACLFLAESFHYMAVLAAAPFGLAEIAYSLRYRKIRIGVWLAMACVTIPLVMSWPLLRALKTAYAAHAWMKVIPVKTAEIYGWVFGMPYHLKILTVAILAYVIGGFLLLMTIRKSFRSQILADPSFYEFVLAVGLLAMPIVGMVAAKANGGILAGRQLVAVALGFPLLAGYLLPRLGRTGVIAFGVAVFLTVGFREARFWHDGRAPTYGTELSMVRDMVSSVGHRDLPAVVSDGLVYLPAEFYASPALRNRLTFLADVQEAVRYAGTDSIEEQLLILRRYSGLNVVNYADFVVERPEFLLYSSGIVPWDWWPEKLRKDGHSMECLASDGQRSIYLVRLKHRVN